MTNRIDQRQRRKLSRVGLVGVGEKVSTRSVCDRCHQRDVSFRANDEAGKSDSATRQTFGRFAEGVALKELSFADTVTHVDRVAGSRRVSIEC